MCVVAFQPLPLTPPTTAPFVQAMRGAPTFFAVPHIRGVPIGPPTRLHSELKRDWRVIVDGEADPARIAFIEPSPQGTRLSPEGLKQVLAGEGPFDAAAIAAATAAVRATQAEQQAASAAALAAAGGPKTTTPKATPRKKRRAAAAKKK